MTRNVSKPTYFRSDHVLNSTLVSDPCNDTVFVVKLIQNFIEHNFINYFKTLPQGSYTCIARICIRKSAVHVRVHATFLTS